MKTAQAELNGQNGKAAQALQQAQATVSADTQAIKTAQSNYNQTKEPPTQAELDAANGAVQQAQVGVQTAETNLAGATLKASRLPKPTSRARRSRRPAPARSGRSTAWSGSTFRAATPAAARAPAARLPARASTDTGFILLTNLPALQVVAQVNEADMAKIALGDPVQFTVDAFPGQTFSGKVAVIQPIGSTSNNIVNYNVTSTIDATQTKLLPGMTATVNIITASASNTTVVPSAALTYGQVHAAAQATGNGTSGQGASSSQSKAAERSGEAAVQSSTGATAQSAGSPAMVLVSQNGKATPRTITVGINDGQHAQVLTGLTPGEQVVIGLTIPTTTTMTAQTQTSSRQGSVLDGGGAGGLPAGVPGGP